MKLPGRDTRYLRSKGHHLSPAVMVGREGVSEAVLIAVNEALASEELIKIRILDTCEGDRKEVAQELAEQTGAWLVQVLGRTLLLYIPNPEEPRLKPPSLSGS